MVSAIDPSKPEDGLPSVKVDLRDNLQAAKDEIEALQTAQLPSGGGIGQFLGKASSGDFDTAWFNASAGSSLVLSVTAFGAQGNNSNDDTAAIQATTDALPDRGGIVFFPRGIYRTASTITIPTVSSGVLKPVRLMGENANALDGGVTGWAGGASAINYVGSGTCIDASGGTRVNPLNPWWAGGIRDLAIHKGGAGQIGIKANALLSSQFYNVLVRGFTDNWRIEGEYFYALWVNCLSYRGQFAIGTSASSGDGPKANGAVFFNCHFSECGSYPAVLIGEDSWPGQMIKFQNCYFEQNDNLAISAKNVSSLYLDQCYFEGNALTGGNAFIFFGTLGGSMGELVLDKCYARIITANRSLVEFKAGSSGSEGLITLQNCKVSAEKSGQNAILRNGSTPANPSIIAIGNRTLNSSQSLPIYSGTVPGQTLNFNAIDCAFTEDKTGNRTMLP
jgi:hypothetical protein